MSLTDFARGFAPPVRSPRLVAGLCGLALGLCVFALADRLSPDGGRLTAFLLALVAAVGSLALSASSEMTALSSLARVTALAALSLLIAAFSGLGPDRLVPVFGLASLGLLAWGAAHLIRTSPRLAAPSVAALSLGASLIAVLGVYNVYYVLVSRDLMIADFMYYRKVSVLVASLLDRGRLPDLIVGLASSLKDDYSLLPGLAPGFALALGAPLSRAVYQGAIIVCYAAPAIYALGWLAREIARRVAPGADLVRRTSFLAFAMTTVLAAYPTGFVVAARGMPDIGGLALYVVALRLAERLARALALRSGHDAHIRALVRRLALSLALVLLAMFFFRRWYAFAVVGLCAMLAIEIALCAWRDGPAFRWRETALAAGIGALTALALASPVIVDWLPDPAAHDYASIYAAYRKPPQVFLALIGDWFGWSILALAALGALFAILRSRDARLARMTFGAAIVAAWLFLRVQTPYVHHLYLIAPAVTTAIAVPLLKLFARARFAAIAAVGALAMATLTPAGGLAPRGVFPIAGRPVAPRTDLAELARMKTWVDERARPDHKVCGLGSSYTFSGQLIDELWQIEATRSPLYGDPRLRPSVKMSDVDTVEGPPSSEIKDCAVIIVGDPVQTHLIPSYQQDVILPSREMLTGDGIGAHYRRTGEVFRLENGVNAVVFDRVSPLEPADVAALTERWRQARASAPVGLRGPLTP